MINFTHLLDTPNDEKKIKSDMSNYLNNIPFMLMHSNHQILKKRNNDLHDSQSLQLQSILLNYNIWVYEKEKRQYEQKQVLKKALYVLKTLHQMLHDFNKTSQDNQSIYRHKKKNIKELFHRLYNCPMYFTDYISSFTISEMYEKCISLKLNDHKENEEGEEGEEGEKGEKGEEDKGKDVSSSTYKTIKPKKTKNKHNEKNEAFPFKKKKECLGRSTTKPTFVSKQDLIRKLDKMGYREKSDKSLDLMTKDELCQLFFKK